jgi:ABC-2 type transport system permease protein
VIAAALRAEWTKTRTIRSTWWSLGVAVVVTVLLAVYFGQVMGDRFADMDADRQSRFDPTQFGFLPLTMGLIAIVVFGALSASSEFTTGTIQPSLAGVPRRGVFFTVKLAVATTVALGASVLIAFGSFTAAQTGLGPHGTTLGAPGVLRAVVGACLYLTLMCVFATGLATMLRSTALSLGIMVPILFLTSQGAGNVPAIRSVTQYLPDQAGFALMRVRAVEPGVLGHTDYGWAGALAILAGWAAVAVLGGYLTLRHRDVG